MMLARNRLPELKAANLPHATWRDLATLTQDGEPTPKTQFDLAAMDAYLAAFLPPGNCICCGAQQGSTRDSEMLDALLGRAKFRWGLANGEGACSGCGWPARAYHRDFGPVGFMSVILQYHPDGLSAEPAP